jgi:hypothetical protein
MPPACLQQQSMPSCTVPSLTWPDGEAAVALCHLQRGLCNASGVAGHHSGHTNHAVVVQLAIKAATCEQTGNF